MSGPTSRTRTDRGHAPYRRPLAAPGRRSPIAELLGEPAVPERPRRFPPVRDVPSRRRPAPSPATTFGSEILAWLERHSVSLALGGGLLLVAALVLGIGATRFPAFSDDEGTYVAQAWSLLTEGSLAHYTYWYDHPPLGWLQLAGASWLLDPILGGPAVVEGRRLMLLPALASCALLYLLARRLGVRRGFAAAAVLLFALSPLSVSYLRMVYLDNVALPWILASFVLAASPRARLWAYAGSGACFAIAVLSKETTLLLLPALLLLVWQGLDRRTRSFCLTAFGSVLVLLLLGYPVYAVLKGELLPGPDHVSLLEAVQFQLYGRASTGSVLAGDSVSRQLVESWLALDAWLPALGLAAAPFAVGVKRLRPIGLAVLILVVMALRPGYLPQPYVIALLPFLALAAAGVLDAGSRRLAERLRSPRLKRAAMPVALLAPLLLLVASWSGADRFAMKADQTGNVIAAQRWIASELHPKSRVMVDDTMYVDLVRSGFAPRFGAVWFFKLDFTTNLDPSIAANLPQGWRAFDYAVSTRVIRSALAQNPGRLHQVRLALRNSRPVKVFGAGADRVEVRRIVGVGTGSGLIPARAKGHDRESAHANVHFRRLWPSIPDVRDHWGSPPAGTRPRSRPARRRASVHRPTWRRKRGHPRGRTHARRPGSVPTTRRRKRGHPRGRAHARRAHVRRAHAKPAHARRARSVRTTQRRKRAPARGRTEERRTGLERRRRPEPRLPAPLPRLPSGTSGQAAVGEVAVSRPVGLLNDREPR